jgi:hypothetical protein
MDQKTGYWTDTGSFIDAFLGPNNIVCASITDDELSKDGFSYTKVALFIENNWHGGGDFKWDVIAISRIKFPLAQYVMVGVYGEAYFVGGGDMHEEKIEDKELNPSNFGQIRNTKSIEGYLYVCGMKRQVYKRFDVNNWELISYDLTQEKGVFGFESIDGFSENEIYAVGWEGEIWQYDGKIWKSRNSGTKEILIEVVCGGDNNVYTISRGRKLIVGRNETWKTFELNIPIDILSIAWFDNRLYACSFAQLFEWNGNNLIPVEITGDKPNSIHKINVGEGKLCIVGSKDLFVLENNEFTRID